MRVAVCIFGLCRGDVETCLESHKQHTDKFDTFYGTWSDLHSLHPKHVKNQRNFEDILPNTPLLTLPEPKMHYHPFASDTSVLAPRFRDYISSKYSSKARNPIYDRQLHQTKQILGHAYQLQNIPDDYDMIVRLRFDTRLSRKVDFTPFIKQSFAKNCAIGFGDTLGRQWTRNFNFDVLRRNENPPPFYINDFMIVHPRKIFDPDMVFDLHENKQLLHGERGWYQVLSHPNDTHQNVLDGANLDRIFK